MINEYIFTAKSAPVSLLINTYKSLPSSSNYTTTLYSQLWLLMVLISCNYPSECKLRGEYDVEKTEMKSEWQKEVQGLKRTHKKEMDVRPSYVDM